MSALVQRMKHTIGIDSFGLTRYTKVQVADSVDMTQLAISTLCKP